jgi:outer membrane receptor protein involved in Fe transport
VVTATKRTTTLQETPISIAAVSGEDLQQRGISDINTLVKQIPGVSFQSVGPGRTNFNIRGLSDTGGASPTVGFYLDDVPITPATSAISAAGKSEISPDLYDLERVEVLRGPQGTLYGAGSEGGTIRLLTAQPKLDRFEASGQAVLSNTDRSNTVNYAVNGMTNLNLIDEQLALRLVAAEKYDGGYIDRVVVSPFPSYTNGFTARGDVAAAPVAARYDGVNSARTSSLRALLLWQPIDNLKITPSVVIQNIYQGGQNSFDLPPGNFAHYQAGDVPEQFDETFNLYALNVKYEWQSVTLQSTTSQMNTHVYNIEDVAEQWYGFFLPYGAPFLTQGAGWERHNQRQFSEELRLSSSGHGALQWVLGAFYNSFKDTLAYDEESGQLVAYDGSRNVFTDNEPDHLKQSALFGEATYALLPSVKVTLGLRYFHYDFDFLQSYSGLATAPPLVSTGTTSASGTTPKVGFTYLPTENLTLFASASKGFRPGSANLPIPPSFCGVDLQTLGVSTYKPDSVWSYELGEKAKLLNGTVGLRASGYYIDWKDIQQNVPLACGYGYTANAGGAVSKGAELEFDARLGRGFTLHENIGYTDAKITSSAVGSALAVGSPLANVPKWTVDSSFEFLKPLANGWNLGIRGDDEYISSEYDPNAQPYPVNQRGGYNILNARLGLEMQRFSAYLFASNLLNRVGYVGFDRSEAQNTPQYARVIPTIPRIVGVDAQVRF